MFSHSAMILQVREVISTGVTDGIPCVIIQPAFYENRDYSSSAVHAALHKAKKG